MAKHDHSYKLLFSHPEMVRDLLEGFVHAEWLAELDYGSLEKVGSSYVSDDLHSRSDDVVWRVRWGRNWIYIYLLIEFQSRPETFMALRILTYGGLLYQDLLNAKQIPARGLLPPLLPIVLYNGAEAWNAPHSVGELIEAGPPALEPYRLQSRYLLIDERRYRDSELLPLRNLAAALFRLETSRNLTDVRTVLQSLLEWLKSPDQESLRRAFAVWINRVILERLPSGPVAQVEDLQTMGTLLETRIQEWAEEARREGLEKGLLEGRREGRREGRQEGRREGRQEGRQEGEASLLHRQLCKRFGELPDWVSPRLRQAQPDQLERWGERLLEARSLDAVFADD